MVQKKLTIESVLLKAKSYLPEVNEARVLHAYEYATDAHNGQLRYSGEPYMIHPLHTADFLMDFYPDEDSIIAALLHDVSEDTEKTLDDIEHEFGKEVRNLVYGMEKLSKVRSRFDEPQAENLRKMFLVMAKDFRVVMIKLCDRLHNIKTLKYVPKEKQKRIAKETLEIYAPIAARLGIYKLKTQLEDNAFEFLEPDVFNDISTQLKASFKRREAYMAESGKILTELLAVNGVQGEVSGRLKGVYSIYRKMKRKGKSSIKEVFDVFAMRIVLPNIFKYNDEFTGHLYTTLGLIHSRFTPLAHRFKDYIAVPKVNGYRSLHTTVMGLGMKESPQPTEIQLRTNLMHEQAEFGVAAHWLYESAKGSLDHANAELSASVLKKQMNWMQGLSRLQSEVKSNEELMQDLKVDVFQDRIFVFTPNGEVKDLPKNATPVDFAYTVHTDVGNHCAQAKVNGNIVSLNYELSNGEVIEIVTRKNAEPNQNWLSFVRTNHAKSRVRAWLKGLDRDKNLRLGKDLFNKQLERIAKPPLTPDLNVLKFTDGKRKNLKDREELLVELAKGTLMPSTLLKKIFSIEEIMSKTVLDRGRPGKLTKEKGADSAGQDAPFVFVGGREDMPVQLAKCCNPTTKDSIVGFITRGRGVITVHKTDCQIVNEEEKDRLQNAYWISPGTGKYKVTLRIEAGDRIGLIRDISAIFTKFSINIMEFNCEISEGRMIMRDIAVDIDDFDQLDSLLYSLEQVPGVERATLQTPLAHAKKTTEVRG